MLSTIYLRTYIYVDSCCVRVVKFLEKVIIKRNTDLKCPLKCKINRETFLCEKSDVCWEDPPRENPVQLIRIRLRQRASVASPIG